MGRRHINFGGGRRIRIVAECVNAVESFRHMKYSTKFGECLSLYLEHTKPLARSGFAFGRKTNKTGKVLRQQIKQLPMIGCPTDWRKAYENSIYCIEHYAGETLTT